MGIKRQKNVGKVKTSTKHTIPLKNVQYNVLSYIKILSHT